MYGMPGKFFFLAWALSASFVFAGCSGDAGPRSRNLTAFSDCEELRQYIIEQADAGGGASTTSDGKSGAPPPSGQYGETGGSLQYTDTNVQEPGVDEPDIIKTDGQFIYVVSGGFFVILDSWPASDTGELARYGIEGNPISMFVQGDRAIIFSTVWDFAAITQDFAPRTFALLKATVVDVADRSEPALLRETYFEGMFNEARMVDGVVHVVMRSWISAGGGSGSGGVVSAAASGGALEEVFPRYMDTVYSDGGTPGVVNSICACQSVYRPPVPDGAGVITIFSIDLADPAGATGSVALLGDGGVVYGSQKSIYVASPNYAQVWSSEWEPGARTAVHRFALGAGASASYQASGVVRGWVLNQFSMSEHEGAFRIATTEPGWLMDADPVNSVYVLVQEGRELKEAGSITGLGKPGESIFAVRFLGQRGFVVTFERTDPLYTLDLSEPSSPKVAGELEAPGFSTYLHPIGRDHLLAIGQNTAGSVDLSIFDVSDFAAPRLANRVSMGAGTYSEAMYNHKAFTYFPALGALAVPVTAWSGAPADYPGLEVFNGLYLYHVDPQKGFTWLGSIDHSSFYNDRQNMQWYYPESVRRSLFIGNELDGYFVYSLSGRGLKATPFDDLTNDVASVGLPAADVLWAPVSPAIAP